MLYEYIFLESFADNEQIEPFCLCQGYPRKLIPCLPNQSISDVDINGLLTMECTGDFELIDPLKLLPFLAEVSLRLKE